MASITLSGASGNRSGNLSYGTAETTSYAYSIGWSSIPMGSQITSLSWSASSSASTVSASAYTTAEATREWPTLSTDSEHSQNPSALVSGGSGYTTIFFSGNPGNIGSGWIRTDESFYNVTYEFSSSTTPTISFNPPGSRTLFFGTAN